LHQSRHLLLQYPDQGELIWPRSQRASVREWADLAGKGSFVLEGILDYWFTLQLHPLKPRVTASRLINISSFVDGQGEEAHREFNKAEILTALVPEVELIFIPLSVTPISGATGLT
jgi:hypothetical protein